MEQYGSMEIINHATGHKACLTFKQAGGNSKDLHRVEGYIMDKRSKSLAHLVWYKILCFFSKHKLFFIYGKWTEFLKCTDYNSYEEYLKENAHKFKKDEIRSKSPSDSPSHTPKKVLQKLNSLKVSTFSKSTSAQEVISFPILERFYVLNFRRANF